MTIVAIMPVRSEGWVVGFSLRVALLWVDQVVLLNHASSDDTCERVRQIAIENPGRVHILADGNPRWDEMVHRQRLLEQARRVGATHIAMIDADEIVTGNVLPNIREHTKNTRPERILHLPIYNCRGSIERYHATGIWGNRVVSVSFADQPEASWHGDRFHHREPFGLRWTPYQPVAQANGGILHLWGVTERRLVAKHALYKCTERLRWPQKPVAEIEQTYNLAIKESCSAPFGAWTFKDTPESWLGPYRRLMEHLSVNDDPWQEGEVRRLVSQYGPHHFAGLDLFGVV